jgi:hypothetical protein
LLFFSLYRLTYIPVWYIHTTKTVVRLKTTISNLHDQRSGYSRVSQEVEPLKNPLLYFARSGLRQKVRVEVRV